MKVLVWFPSQEHSNFEGVRLRKSIKGALELNGVTYTTNPIDYYDVAHFLSVKDEGKINECIENNIPVVISALGCEGDPLANYLELKIDKKGNRTFVLQPKALRVLNKATLIITPTQEAKKFLIDNGVNPEIEVLSPGVNLSRFDFSRMDEKEIFYRYYGEDRNKKLVVAVGGYTKNSSISTFIKAAKKCPNVNFYYFSNTTKHIPLLIRKDIKFAPKNVKFKQIPTDDVYRSALINAILFMYPGYSITGTNTLLEAMAARCQIVIREQPFLNELLTDGESAYICKYSETIASVVKDCLEGKIKDLSQQAYQISTNHSLDMVGQKLKHFYQEAINIK